MKAWLSLVVILISACAELTPVAGNNVALSKEKFPSSSTVIFGRIIDLNPKSIKSKLQLTYMLSDKKEEGMFSGDTNFPNIDPETNFFWIAIPSDKVQYFGVRSIRFEIDGITQTAIMRNDNGNRPLFGIPLKADKDAKYIYVGDITIRSGLRKTTSGLSNLDTYDIKEAYNKSNPASARSYLEEKGVDSKKLIIQPLNLKKI